MLLVYVFTMLYFLAFEYSCLKQFITKCGAHTAIPSLGKQRKEDLQLRAA